MQAGGTNLADYQPEANRYPESFPISDVVLRMPIQRREDGTRLVVELEGT